MSNRRTLLVALLIYSLILSGLAALNGALIALTLPFLFYVLAAIYFGLPKPQITVERTLSHAYLMPGKPGSVSLDVHNKGPDLEEIVIRDIVPPGLEVEGDSSVMISLPSNTSHRITYRIKGPRGTYHFGTTHCTVRDRFGLVQRNVKAQSPTRLSILPRVEELRSIDIRPRRTRGFAGPIPSREAGSGTDFFGVREYEPGDPRRWINWRISARYPHRIFTNEFEQARIADVGLILDARQRTNVTRHGQALFDHAVRATAALADTFLKEGNRVGLLIYGRGLERTHPGYGKHQRQRILQALAYAQTGDSLVFDNLDYLPTRFFPAESQIVLISPLCEDDPPVLSRVRSHGYSILVVSPDPVTFEAQTMTTQDKDLVETARDIAALERGLWMRSLQRVGIQVVDWNVNHPLDTAIQATLSRMPRGQLREQIST